ncbi:ATP-dependent DNA helicase RecG [Breoghania sp.]|uniref:ATP-dependent DNA helicase RecG n=1 Tax=Breoghania sp. TaxID=2065378 RepID=UPI002AA70DC5|nr:ATP-dependent DNA helicase RecG [Breoghania sp.]
MRPPLLDPLFAAATDLPGIGPKVEKLLKGLLGVSERDVRIGDLLFHLPHSVIDRRRQPGIANAPEGAIVTLKVHVDRHQAAPASSRAPYKVLAHDETGDVQLVFFHARRDWLERTLPIGETRYVSGKVEWFNGRAQMVHPDHMVDEEDFATMPLVEPVYPMTAGLSPKTLQKAIGAALALVPEVPEWLDEAHAAREHWPEFKSALETAHRPDDPRDIAATAPAICRLAYDEFLASQLALAMVRAHMRKTAGVARMSNGRLKQKILAALPFDLTPGQVQAIADIEGDLSKPERMLRLVQGDVGAGKTLVGLIAMAHVVEAGSQAAMMAPTELLARQHLRSIEPLCEAAGIKARLLTGKAKPAERREILEGLATGEIDILVGTHALFQATIEFRDLALAVVDEQHRFGVHQRLALQSKGRGVDVLVMTATPIPRTLVLTYFGDMEVSQLPDKPAGRQPIETRTVSLDRLSDVVDGLQRALNDGQKVYWVCPLVEESEVLDVTAAEERYATLVQVFGTAVSLVHGRMSAAEKDEAMNAFKSGETRILVATTVIEVGVDVSDATIIVIEHAERFGLAQLHQLRGRVGRGERASTCLLLYKGPLGETAKARLAIMRETNDGFLIAEEDLRLRGEGEILGTRQSGMPGFRIAQIEAHAGLMETARADARLILANDPELEGPRGQALRLLLYIFGRDEAIRLLRAG